MDSLEYCYRHCYIVAMQMNEKEGGGREEERERGRERERGGGGREGRVASLVLIKIQKSCILKGALIAIT